MKQVQVKAVPSISYGRIVYLAKPNDAKGEKVLATLKGMTQFMKNEGTKEEPRMIRDERVTFSPAMVEYLRAVQGIELIISELDAQSLPTIGQAIDRKSATQEDRAIDLSFV